MVQREDEIRGWLSIMASMVRNCSIEDLWSFIGQYKGSCGLFIHAEDKKNLAKQLKPENQRLLMIEYILSECQNSPLLAIDLQKHFGQFDGAQICENCGEIMWSGYSVQGSTYCSLDCALNGTNWELKQLAEELEHANEIDGDCYYTEFG